MTETKEREAACACGQLKLRLTGEPDRVSSCHCQACQRRTGAIFGSTAFTASYDSTTSFAQVFGSGCGRQNPPFGSFQISTASAPCRTNSAA